MVIILVASDTGVFGKSHSFPAPSKSTPAHLSPHQRIVALADSQVGYSTDPSNSYCNKCSACWNGGITD